jgi:transposase
VQGDVWRSATTVVGGRVPSTSVFAFLHAECHRLFPDQMFDDLYSRVGRRSVSPMVLACTTVLQRLFCLSDREAVEAVAWDLRWKYACGGLDVDAGSFDHTVLVEFRARLAGSEAPERVFDAVLEMAARAGMVGRKRVLDSTPVYDGVATMDTVTLVRAGIRGVLGAAAAVDAVLETRLRGVLTRDDDYLRAGKPVCEDWDDRGCREALVDALARDGYAVLAALEGVVVADPVARAARLLARLLGQDLEEGEDGCFRIARRVAKDRVISTVDPDARHGHKTSAHGFDGYKG